MLQNVPFQALVPMFPVLDFMADYTAESLWPTGCLFFLMKRTVNLRVPVVPGQKTIFAPDFHRDLEDFDISDVLFAKEHP